MPITSKRVLRTFGYAMYFDGVDDYVRTQGNINLTPPFTVEVWTCSFGFKPSQSWPTVIANAGGGALAHGFKIIYYAGTGNIHVEWGTGTSGQSLPGYYPVPLYAWHNVVLVYEGIGKNVKLYVDNQLVRSATLSVNPSKNYPLYLASASLSSNFYYYGIINEVHIYNRALSGYETSWNYLHPDDIVKDGLILWFKAHPDNVKDINNDGILEWIDLSGNNNHGKIYGATLTKVVKDPIPVSQPKRILSVVR